MKYLAMLAIFLALPVLAQEAGKTPDLKLTEVETLRWEKIQLLAGKLNSDYKIDEYNAKMAELQKQLAALNTAVLESRKLEAKDYQASWQAVPPTIVKKVPAPTETAKK